MATTTKSLLMFTALFAALAMTRATAVQGQNQVRGQNQVQGQELAGNSQSAETGQRTRGRFNARLKGRMAGHTDQPGETAAADEPWKFEGRLHLEKGTGNGYIVLQVDLAPGSYIYSVSPEGSPAPTRLEVVTPPGLVVGEAFSPNLPPTVVELDPVFNRRIEKHKTQVQFFVPCQVTQDANFENDGWPAIQFDGQVCAEGGVCIPIRGQQIPVVFAGYFERSEQSASSGNAQASGIAPPTVEQPTR